ncbi:MAG: hypothetical protein ACRDRG_08360 [Pseudonocardiaceae bacterium]
MVLIAAVAIGGSDTPGTSTTPAEAGQEPPAEQPAGPVTSFGDGTFVVGSDISGGPVERWTD